MERHRYEVTLRCGGGESVMWTNRLDELRPVLELAITGSQAEWRMGCAVRDVAAGAFAEVSAATPVGFWPAVRSLLRSIERCEPQRLREGAGRDVVVEVMFAAHDATLEQCRDFAGAAVDAAMRELAEAAAEQEPATPAFSYNGPLVGQAWFQ